MVLPSLPSLSVPDLSSVPSPVLFFACFLVALSFLGAFALRLAGLDDEPEYYEEVGLDGKARVAFQFPPHENRVERRKRWARALRRRFWAGLAPGPGCPEAASRAEKEADLFLRAIVSASCKPGDAPTPHRPAIPQAALLDPECDLLLYSPAELDQSPPGPVEISPQEASRVRKKIFSVVMSAGPPKALPPITEEDFHQSGDLESGEQGGAGRVLIGRASLPPNLHSAWQALGWQALGRSGKASCRWSDLDSEPIMTVGHVSATRSVLWETLRRLEQAEQQATTQGPEAPSPDQ